MTATSDPALKLNEDGVILLNPPRLSASALKDAVSGCLLRGVLDKMYDTDKRFGWNILGTSIHSAIEQVAIRDLDLDAAIEHAHDMVWDALQRWAKTGKTVRYSKGRGIDTIDSDIEDMLTGWFEDVHPDSEHRLPIYAQHEWPFGTEVPLVRPGMHTIVDALFTLKGTPGVVSLVDWKTGANTKADPKQLHFYEWAWPQFYPDDRVSGTWFHHLADGSLQHVDDYPGIEWMAYLVEYAETIINNDTLRLMPKPHWVCGRADLCPHKDHCPAFDGDLHTLREHVKLIEYKSDEATGGQT